jgi:competence protein ComEA
VPPILRTAWPRSAQLTTAFLLGVAATLLLVQVLGQLRSTARPTELTYRVDLNRAGHAELLQLPGVGESLARQIESYRDEHGGFHQVEELTNVHGIGPATLERLRPCVYIRFEDATDAPERPARLVRKSRPADTAHQPSASKKGASLTGPIDLNRATEADLQKIPGIGPTLARRIVEERGKRPFQSVDDLGHVPGIKQKKLDQVRPYVTVEPDPVRSDS